MPLLSHKRARLEGIKDMSGLKCPNRSLFLYHGLGLNENDTFLRVKM